MCRESDCALEAIKGELTLAEISSRYDVHATQVNQCKRQAVTGSPGLFIHKTDEVKEDYELQLAERNNSICHCEERSDEAIQKDLPS